MERMNKFIMTRGEVNTIQNAIMVLENDDGGYLSEHDSIIIEDALRALMDVLELVDMVID